MTDQDLIQSVIAMPAVRQLALPPEKGGIGLDLAQLTADLQSQARNAAKEMAGAYGWDFALTSTTTTSVANQSEYTLLGADSDCVGIFDIRYGSDALLLVKKTRAAMDDYLSRRTAGTVAYWVPESRQDGFPVVKLVATPSTSGDTINYRYWRNDVTVEEFTPPCEYALQLCLAKRVVPSLEGLYTKALREAISAYNLGSWQPNETMLDSEIVAANNRRSLLHGW